MRVIRHAALLAFLALILPGSISAKSVLVYNLSLGDYDTGLAISNAGEGTGTVLFRLFVDENGVKKPVEISSSDLAEAGLGGGADTQGRVPPGGTYTILASEVARFAGLSAYIGQIVIEADFEEAQAVNFIYNNRLGSAHGYSAAASTGGGGLAIETFWGRQECPSPESIDVEELTSGIVYAATVVGSVGGLFCADQIDGIPDQSITEVEIQRVFEKKRDVGQYNAIPCVVCAFRSRP